MCPISYAAAVSICNVIFLATGCFLDARSHVAETVCWCHSFMSLKGEPGTQGLPGLPGEPGVQVREFSFSSKFQILLSFKSLLYLISFLIQTHSTEFDSHLYPLAHCIERKYNPLRWYRGDLPGILFFTLILSIHYGSNNTFSHELILFFPVTAF